MAVSLVGSAGTVATGGASASPTFGQATTAGSLLVAWVAFNSITTRPTTSATGWVRADASNAFTLDVWYRANCGAGEGAPTFTAGGTPTFAVALAEFSGVASASPVDQTGTGSGGVSPTTATAAGADAVAAELVLAASSHSYSKAGTTTTTHTYNNGATANFNANNDGTSTAFHYRFSYGVTTSNGAADNVSNADSSMNLSGISGQVVSFKLAGAATPASLVPGTLDRRVRRNSLLRR